ncbi:unnamed protein product [Callosobruchus maculatus]|uniref:Down syndrome cell adhesion molecule-like protein Dscam2 n=1 Tax=Callosobruchus maculatus TaxID=64391 RepID=A0A653D0C9_CALMS|nr:unnamed protein product [Callosobruchus maculatus]
MYRPRKTEKSLLVGKTCSSGRTKLHEPTNNLPPKLTGERTLGKILSFSQQSTAVLLCPVVGYPFPKFKWYKFIEGTNRKQAVTLDERVKQVAGTLIIREAKVEDSGKYLCVVNNSVGGESVETVLTVTAPLKAKIEPPVQTVDFGRPAVFTCKFEGNPIKTISWLKDGNKLDHSDAVLRIEAVRKEDKGMYQCFVRNDQESAEATAELKLGGRFEPPQIRHAFDTETVQPGNSVFLKCIASGNPTPEITWELYGRKLSNNEVYQIGQYVTVNGDVVSHLNISSIRTNDGGLYRCVASSKVGTTEHSARINVYGLPVVRSMEKQAIVAGGTLIVHCPFAGHPVDSVVWERDGRLLPINRKQKVFPNGTLIIENVERASDQATYVCVAKNSQGYSARGSLEVQVMVPPKIHQFSFGDEPSFVRETVSVQCTVSSGDQPISFSWMFNGKPIRNEVGISVGSMSKKISYLTIDSVSEEHIGNYTCVAANRAGMSTFSTALVVKVLPRITPFGFEDSPVHSGQFVEVTCTVSEGDLPVQITWQLNGRDFDNFPEVTTTKVGKRTSVLSIESVSYANAGIYTCLARNRAGEAVFSAELQVNVPPQIVPFDFGNKPVHSGEFVQVYCTVNEGDLPLIIKWNLNGHHLDNFLDLTVAPVGRRASILSIESVSYEHVGNFTCIAKNRAGVARYSAQLQVNVTPQITAFDFGDGPVHSGQFVQVTCTAFEGDLPLKIEWLLNGRPLGDLSEVTVSTVGKRTSFLSIDSVSYAHAGNYTCRTKNRAGEAAYTSELQVNVPPRIVPFSFGDQVVNAGQATQATCLVSEGDLPLKITWSYDGNAADASFTTIKISPKASLLLIDAASETQAGNYSCTVTNAAGSVSFTASLDVYVPPRWILEPTDKAFAQGSDAVVECKADGFPKPVVTWKRATGVSPGDYRDFKPNNPDIKVEDGTLMINNIQKTNEGYYLCEANNGIGSGLSAVILISVQAPPQFEVKYRNQTAKRGDPAVLQCQAKGEKPIGILWNINNKRLEPKGDNRYTIREEILPDGVVSDLSIKRTERSDSAIFTCVATNAFGSDDTNINMIVQEAPEVPYGLKVLDKSGRSVQLSWVAPYDGNSPIKK